MAAKWEDALVPHNGWLDGIKFVQSMSPDDFSKLAAEFTAAPEFERICSGQKLNNTEWNRLRIRAKSVGIKKPELSDAEVVILCLAIKNRHIQI